MQDVIGKDIIVEQNEAGKAGILDISAGGNVEFERMLVNGGIVDIKSLGSIRFNEITTGVKEIADESLQIKSNSISLSAVKNIEDFNNNDSPVITYHGAEDSTKGSYLALSGESIGSEEKHMIIDIPEQVVLHIPNANEIYIDAVDADFEKSNEGEDVTGKTQRDPDDTEEGYKDVVGDIKSGYENHKKDEFSIAIGIETNEELADFLVEGNIPVQDLVTMISAKLVELPEDEKYVPDENDKTTKVTIEEIIELLEIADADTFDFNDYFKFEENMDPDEKEALKDELKEVIEYLLETTYSKTKTEILPVFDDTELSAMVYDSLTDEDKEEIAKKVWEQEFVYPEIENIDVDYRDLNIVIGDDGDGYIEDNASNRAKLQDKDNQRMPMENTGVADKPMDSTHVVKAVINNKGDININQSHGTLGAEKVKTRYENASIAAEGIKGTDSSNVDIDMGQLVLKATNGGIEDIRVNERIWEDKMIANILGYEDINNASMPSDGTWSITRNPQTGEFEMKIIVGYAQVKVRDDEKETRIDAEATKNVDITEDSGEMGIGIISTTGGDVSITAPQNLVDVTDSAVDGDDAVNINAMNTEGNADGGKVILDVQNGEIGAEDKRIDINAADQVTATAKEDVYVDSDENLKITADSSEGELYVRGDKDVELDNTTGDMNLVEFVAGEDGKITSAGELDAEDIQIGGNADISADGRIDAENIEVGADVDITANGETAVENIEVGGNSNITADDVDVENMKVVGDNSITATEGDIDINHLETGASVDPNSNSVTNMDAKTDINVHETKGDLTAGKIKAGEDIVLNLDDSLKDNDDSDAVKKLADAIADQEQAKAAVETIEKQLGEEKDYVDDLTDAINDAKNALEEQNLGFTDQDIADAKAVIADGNSTKKEKADAKTKLDEYEKKLDEIIAQAGETAGHDFDNIDGSMTIDEIKQLLDDELSEAQKKVTDLTDALGKTDAENGGNGGTGAKGALENAQEAVAAAEQGINNADPSIEAGGNVDITLNGGGTVGTDDNSVSIEHGDDASLSITGEDGSKLGDVHIESNKDINLDPINSDGDVSIDVNGNINPTDNNKPLVTGDSAEINAINGTVGTEDNPVKTDVDKLSSVADEINIDNKGDLEIGELIGVKDPTNPDSGNVNISVGGDITAKDNGNIDDDNDATNGDTGVKKNNIIGNDVDIKAKGDVGTDTDPIKVDSEEISIKSDDLHMESDDDITVDKINAKGDVDITSGGSVKGKDKHSYVAGHDISIIARGDIGEENMPLSIRATGKNVITDSDAGRVFATVSFIRKNNNEQPVTDNSDEDDEYTYNGMPAVKITIPENRVPMAGRAGLFGDDEDEEEVTDGNDDVNGGDKIEETPDDEEIIISSENDIPEELASWGWLIALILALLAIGTILIIVAKKKKEQPKEAEE